MRPSITCASLAVALAACASTVPSTRDGARPVHVIDGHNDLMIHFIDGDRLRSPSEYDISRAAPGQTDVPRWRQGNVAGSFITIGGSFHTDASAGIRQMLRLVHQIVDEHSALFIALRPDQLLSAAARGQTGLILHIEGAGQFGDASEELAPLHALGVRSVGLVWNTTTSLADAAADSSRWNGLSSAGVEFVHEMNRLGMIIDLSHAADSTISDVLEISDAPVILSHSSARAVAALPRNVPDPMIRRVAENGGLVMVSFVPYFTTVEYARWYERGEAAWDSIRQVVKGEDASAVMTAWERRNPPPRVTLESVADHIEHVAAIAGVEHVGLGSDFDGMYSSVEGLEDVSTFPALLAVLRERGWREDALEKLAGGNVLRVWREVESRARAVR